MPALTGAAVQRCGAAEILGHTLAGFVKRRQMETSGDLAFVAGSLEQARGRGIVTRNGGAGGLQAPQSDATKRDLRVARSPEELRGVIDVLRDALIIEEEESKLCATLDFSAITCLPEECARAHNILLRAHAAIVQVAEPGTPLHGATVAGLREEGCRARGITLYAVAPEVHDPETCAAIGDGAGAGAFEEDCGAGLILERVFPLLQLDRVLIAGGRIPVFTCSTQLPGFLIAGMATSEDQPGREWQGEPDNAGMMTCGSDCPEQNQGEWRAGPRGMGDPIATGTDEASVKFRPVWR